MKQTIAIIPARAGSKRIPNKNIINFGGKPLIAHSIEYANQSTIFDDIYVSTDSKVIKDVAVKFGAKTIDRPKALSDDFASTVSVLKHALSDLDDTVETVVLLQPTNPLRPKFLLQEAFKILSKKSHKSLFTVSENCRKLGKISNDKFMPFNYEIGQRSQDLEPLYYENGLLYITTPHLIKKNIIFNEASYPLIVNHKFAEVDIDTYDDLKFAQFVLNNYNEE
ncbi:acylneuraminate cytidylyltransferase family protein [Winogradskyella sp. DF17]|uniref:Acylneuraminate cytidylyltransferase family protein n=1 Tax=Winogradskyella pelagia TaxID=2819984 RepID=A0ABS3T1R2_9FLAO|nr:acylneuraminate cytidylyltransferase family protein [Winogradskyella sp. DF17]